MSEPRDEQGDLEERTAHREQVPSRRSALLRVGKALLIGGAFGAGAAVFHDPKNPVRKRAQKGKTLPSFEVPVAPGTPRLVEVRGADPVKNLQLALKALGGLEQFIRPGDRVLLKPNMAFDRTPELGSNTSPEVMGELTRLCRKAGAKEVVVAENTLFDADRCVESSGIGEAVRRAGGKILIPGKKDYAEVRLGGQVLDSWPFFKKLFEVNKVINVPTAKHHRQSRVSLGMKNWMGAIGGERRRMHQKLAESIADLAAGLRPTLVVLDASRLLMRHGPTGGSLSDVTPGNALIAGWDQVAVDARALPLLGATLAEVLHVTAAARVGVGKLHLEDGELAVINADA
ncbi:MAG: DUF362 domain-containing protein [Polyangia bacterium]|jgi:uncharacterized protein (DUF362 family)|nr:DUF362 domain-containing protein [Polyangia bacterium]